MTDLSFGPTAGGIISDAAAGGLTGGPIGAIGGALIGGASQLLGTSAQNSANKQSQYNQFVDNMALQNQAETYNTGSATTAFNRSQLQMQEQETYNTNMANTAYQRSVADMRKAGLNPIMGVASGGAATPGISVNSPASPSVGAGSVGLPHMENVLGSAVSSALQGAKVMTDLKTAGITQDNTVANTQYQLAQKARTDVDTINAGKQGGLIDQNTATAAAQEVLNRSQSTAAQAAANYSESGAKLNQQSFDKRETYGQGGYGNDLETAAAAARLAKAAGDAYNAANKAQTYTGVPSRALQHVNPQDLMGPGY